MSAINKPEIIRIRVSEVDNNVLTSAGGGALTRNDIASLLVSAAVEAIRTNGGHFQMPLKLKVADPAEELTKGREAPLPKRKAA